VREVYQTGRTHEEQALLMALPRPTDGVLQDHYFRQMQQAEEGERRLRLLTDALPVLISYVDHTFTYRFVNQAYQAWFHQDPATIVGRTPRELVGEAAYAWVAAHLTRALAGERVEFE
jgi:PAS domain-containing protein